MAPPLFVSKQAVAWLLLAFQLSTGSISAFGIHQQTSRPFLSTYPLSMAMRPFDFKGGFQVQRKVEPEALALANMKEALEAAQQGFGVTVEIDIGNATPEQIALAEANLKAELAGAAEMDESFPIQATTETRELLGEPQSTSMQSLPSGPQSMQSQGQAAQCTVKDSSRPHPSSRRRSNSSSLPRMRMTPVVVESETESDFNSVLTGSKLLYFGIPGRGEAIRLALAIGGIEFEDQRVPFPAWGKVKPTTPWGTLPLLQLADGTKLAQSRSILRFVGKNTCPRLYPEDELVAQRVDELMDVLEDLSATITNVGQGLPKEELKAARLTAVSKGGAVYNLLARIEAFIEANGSHGYAVGSEMNIASILTFTTIGRLVGGVFTGVPPTVCNPFPNMQLVRKTVGTDPDVIKWYDARISKQNIESLSPAEQILLNCRDL